MNIYFTLFILQSIYFFLFAFDRWMIRGGVDTAYRESDLNRYGESLYVLRGALHIVTLVSIYALLLFAVFMLTSYIVILTWLIAQLIAVLLNSVVKKNGEHLVPFVRVFHTAIYTTCFAVSIFLWFQLFAQ